MCLFIVAKVPIVFIGGFSSMAAFVDILEMYVVWFMWEDRRVIQLSLYMHVSINYCSFI